MYINGNFVDSNNHIDIENPYTQETFATVPDASTENLESCLKQAKQDQAEWEDTALVERKTLLLEISEIISSNLKKLAEIESTEIGKPIKETLLVDVPIASKVFEYYASILDSFNFSYSFSNSDMNMIHYKPFGIAGILLPYNVPLMIFAFNVAPALAAGNAVIVKPSEFGSLSILELANHINELNFPKGIINILTGKAETTGSLLASSDVDLLSYTGSSRNLLKMFKNMNKPKKVITETSGINIAVVFNDAQLDEAVENVTASSFMKQGQMCINTSICLIEDDIYDVFLEKIIAKISNIRIGNPLSPLTGIGPLRSKTHLQKTMDEVENILNKGGKLLVGGNKNIKGYFYEPTIIELDELIYEECFNPVLMVKSFKRNDLNKYLENNPTGLVLQIWTKNLEIAKSMAIKAKYGNIWINTFAQMDPSTPFGGFKESGWGRVLGKWGLFEYLQPKNIGISFGKSKVSGWFS
jgi:acyl-CoA reductase-like NAD-dependent aldehyde dehydrogenase